MLHHKTIPHGHTNSNSRIHVTWSNMRRRCLNPTDKEKTNYTGISTCKEWDSFVVFLEWAVANGYTDKLTIDRLDSSKGYSPDNCRFVDYSVQSANRKKTSKNKSGYIGVHEQRPGIFRAYVEWKYKKNHLGSHKTAKAAAIVRDAYVVEHGLPHKLNFIE